MLRYGRGMGAVATCRACGGRITITDEGAMVDSIARGDSFFHRGCIEAKPGEALIDKPAYLIPKTW